MSLEYLNEANKVAGFVERILEVDHVAKAYSILRYCMELYFGGPWTAKLYLACMDFEASKVFIEYEGDKIRCQCYLTFDYKLEKYQERHASNQKRPTTRHNSSRRRPSSEPAGHHVRTRHLPNPQWSMDSKSTHHSLALSRVIDDEGYILVE